MAILEVVLRQIQGGQELINRWNYTTASPSTTGGLSVALVKALGGDMTQVGGGGAIQANTMFSALQLCQSDAIDFVDVSARVLYSLTDFYEVAFPANVKGGVVNTGGHAPMPPFVTFGFYTARVRTDIRRGQKRFSGLTEVFGGSNGDLDEGFVSGAMSTLASAMSNEIEADTGSNIYYFSPAICGKEKYTTPSGKSAYRYYETEAAQMEKTASSVTWFPKTTARSQVSRQYGRGR